MVDSTVPRGLLRLLGFFLMCFVYEFWVGSWEVVGRAMRRPRSPNIVGLRASTVGI